MRALDAAGGAFPFRALGPDDRDMFVSYQRATEISCRSFVSLYAYAEEDGVRVLEDDQSGCLMCVCLNDEGALCALPPLGARDSTRFSRAINSLRAFFALAKAPMRFIYVEEGELARFGALSGYKITAGYDANYDDYLCETARLMDFAGGVNYNRRQSRNKFLRRHAVDIDLNPRAGDLSLISDAWCARRDCAECGYRCPRASCDRVINNIKRVGARVMMMRMDGEPEAMIVVGPMSGDTYDLLGICNRTPMEGLTYAFLELACKHCFPDAAYLNLEEDLGLDNLRHIKRLLRPVSVVHKYELRLE